MKNYYEILEVDKHASSEIIDKAYKILAKRYHPDMHDEVKKEWAEENFKMITEAYEILSDEKSRKEYDKKLALSTIDYSVKYKELCKKQDILKQELEALRKKYNSSNIYNNQTSNYYNNINNTNKIFYKKNYDDYNDKNTINNQESEPRYRIIMKNLGHTIKQKRTFRDFLAFVMTILVLIFILFLLLNIPYTRNYLISAYEENFIIKTIVDIFIR